MKTALNYKDPSSSSSLSHPTCMAILSDLSFLIYKMGLQSTGPTSSDRLQPLHGGGSILKAVKHLTVTLL